jgi:RNA polymerase sigma-70 factor (ECF subfamily)
MHSSHVSTMTATERPTAAELVKEHQGGVWRYLRYLGCTEAEADDLTQETFLAVIKKPFDYQGPAETAGYLRTVARRKFLMVLRQHPRGATAEQLETAESVWIETVGSESVSGWGDDYLDALEECLEQLEGRAKTVIDGRYRDDQSREALAAALGMTEDGVKTLLRRTRDVLRKCVEKKLKE